MTLSIAQRMHPFSHVPGIKFLLPGTTLVLQVYPTRVYFADLDEKIAPFFIAFDLSGPLRDFTVELDLESGRLIVFGVTKKGFMRYSISSHDAGVFLTLEKTDGFPFTGRTVKEFQLGKGERIQICPAFLQVEKTVQERLSLGMHKSQDWDLIQRRFDLKEIFPILLKLCAWLPQRNYPDFSEETFGNYGLLRLCHQKVQQKEMETGLEAFENLFLAAFEGALVPRVVDTDHHGITLQQPILTPSLLAFDLLAEAGRCVRSLFFQETERSCLLLPCLPPQFPCGRMTGVKTLKSITLDMEWRKKKLREVSIHSETDRELCLQLPKSVTTYRLKRGHKNFQNCVVDHQGETVLSLQKDKTVRLDQFQTSCVT